MHALLHVLLLPERHNTTQAQLNSPLTEWATPCLTPHVRGGSRNHSGEPRRAHSGFSFTEESRRTVSGVADAYKGVSRSDGWGRNCGDIYLASAASMATAASTAAAAVLASRFLRRSPRLLRRLGLSPRATPAALSACPLSFRCPVPLGPQQLGHRARMGHSTAAAAGPAAPALGLTKPNAVEPPQVWILARVSVSSALLESSWICLLL